MEFKIFSIVILSGIVVIIITTIMKTFRPSYGNVEKRIKTRWSVLFKAKWEYRFFRVKNKVYNILKKSVILTKAQEREYRRYVDRLNLKWDNEPLDPRLIRVDQYFYLLIFVLIALIAFSFNQFIGVALLIVSPLGYKIPIIDMKEKIDKVDAAISREFNSFYSVVYYQFRKQNKMLSSVVRDYLPNASPEMAFELKIFMQNLTKGEEYALIELRKRLPLKFIIRFCDIMKVRVIGIENISQMMYLKEEMHEQERHRIIKALEKRKKQALALQSAVISFAANDAFLKGVYDWGINVIESVFNVSGA